MGESCNAPSFLSHYFNEVVSQVNKLDPLCRFQVFRVDLYGLEVEGKLLKIVCRKGVRV